MWLVFLHGPPGAGKLTVGRQLEALTNYRLFHNHVVVDALESVFEFGSPPFVELREQLWLAVFREAVQRRVSLIFTFAPECTVRSRFPADVENTVRSAGGRVFYVSLQCSEGEILRRLGEPSRARFNKLTSPDRYRELRDAGAFAFPELPADLTIDTESLTPRMAAERIRSELAAA